MATQTSAFCHTWAAASLETAAAIANVHAAVRSGSDASHEWGVLGDRAEAVIAFYDNEDQDLDPTELARLSRVLLTTAEDFRLLIDLLRIPPSDPRAELYDEFADRAELVALSATDLQPGRVADPPFTLEDFKASIPARP